MRGGPAALAALLMVSVAACTAAPSGPPQIDVSIPRALADTPITVTFSGLPANQHLTVRATTSDARGNQWESHASYLVDTQGQLDLGHTAPQSGSYTGIDAMGLFRSMARVSPNAGYYHIPVDGETVT